MTTLPGLISIVVPTRDQRALLERLLTSLARTLDGHRVELHVVDNASEEPATLAFLEQLPARFASSPFEAVTVHRDEAPFNYSRLNNLGAARARGRFLCLMNDDVEAIGTEDWLAPMLRHAHRRNVGCVGAKLLYPDGTVQHAGIALGMDDTVAGHPCKGMPQGAPGHEGYLLRVGRVSAVTGACLLVRRQVFEEVGGFDERLPITWNDVDLCLRIDAAGYANLWTPEAVLRHHESISRGTRERRDRRARRAHATATARMRQRWGSRLESDPYLPAALVVPSRAAAARSRWRATGRRRPRGLRFWPRW